MASTNPARGMRDFLPADPVWGWTEPGTEVTVTFAGQTKTGSGLWHVHGSSDGRWAVGDDFARNLYLIDRRTDEMILLTAGHKTTAQDHPHPTFSADGTRIQIQSAMLSGDNRSMNICIVPVPKAWLERSYDAKPPK